MTCCAGIVGILLAAGKGTRFGSDKLLHPLADGTPMALVSARKLQLVCPVCIAVLRPEQQALGARLLAEGWQIRYDPDVANGMGHSLAAAVSATPDAAGWLVALADMPFIATETLTQIVTALQQGASLAAPTYLGRRGHPVGFSRDWFDKLRHLQGDKGARDLLAGAAIQLLETDDPGVLADVDTPEGLRMGHLATHLSLGEVIP